MDKNKRIEWVIAAQGGDSRAMDNLLNSCYDDFYYYALQVSKNDEIACDATQDAMLAVVRNLRSLQNPENFMAWSRKILYHECMRHLKKDRMYTQFAEFEDGGSEMDFIEEEKTEFIPDAYMDREDFRQTILKIIASLPSEQRAAVMMYYYDELSVREIAAIQGVTEGTVKSRLNYARKTIKVAVEDYEEKNGVKLHSFALFPLLRMLLGGDQMAHPMPTMARNRIQKALSSSAKVGAPVSAAGSAAKALTVKIAVGIVATMVVGSVVVAGGMSLKNELDSSNRDQLEQESASQAPNAQESLQQNQDYTAEDLTVHCRFDGPVRLLGDQCGWVLDANNRVVSIMNPENVLYENEEKNEVFSFAQSEVGYKDAKGDYYLYVNGSFYRASNLKGKVLYANLSLATLTQYHLYVVTQGTTGELYYNIFSSEGEPIALNKELILWDTSTETAYPKPSVIDFYGAADGFYAEAGGNRYYSRSTSVLEYEEHFRIEASSMKSDIRLLTYRSPALYSSGLFVTDEMDAVYSTAFNETHKATLPQSYTTADIQQAHYNNKAVLVMKDKTVWVLDEMTDADGSEGFYKQESLSAMMNGGVIKKIFLNSDEDLLALTNDNIVYRAK